ncbi:hypothetical protein EV1_002848 [Malus domestica]
MAIQKPFTSEPYSNADSCNALLGHTVYTKLKVSEVASLFQIFQIKLLQLQARRARMFIDEGDVLLRVQFFSFLDEFEKGRVPDSTDLWLFLVERLGIRDVKSCRHEIKFLEKQIVNHKDFSKPLSQIPQPLCPACSLD